MASKRLGYDSKYLERIKHAIDMMATNELEGAPDLHFDDIMGQIGLIRHPQPLLIAGPVTLRVGQNHIAVPAPYLGIPPDRVTGISLQAEVTRVLTIENLTTFHEVLDHLKGDTVVLYTNGMPSPTWRQFYAKLAAGNSLSLHHWGDIDAGGFRIARVIGKVAESLGNKLHLMHMDPAAIPEGIHYRSMLPAEARQITQICAEMGWPEFSAEHEPCLRAYEQEGLPMKI